MPLSPSAQNLVGTPCAPGACEEAQLAAGVCPPDPQLTCQLPRRLPSAGGPPPKIKVVRRATYIANARKGNLFLCPADGTGVIGGLLLQLSYPQRYSHMGVFVDDGFTIRHSTVSQDQMTSEKHMTGSIFGAKAPTHGFTTDAVRYGWPGTITQTVDDAFHQWPGSVTFRDADGDDYEITELSFSDVETTSGDVLSALVVRPCHESTELRDVLSVVTEAVKAINGHYRFYAYTDATVALDPGSAGPPLSVRRMEGGAWVEQNNELVDPSDPCNPARTPVTSTRPVVCSTLPWTAVQLVNDGLFLGRSSRDWGRRYAIELDTGRSGQDGCPQQVSGNPLAHVVDAGTANGLVFFDEPQRASAAAWFYDALAKKIGEQAAQALPSWLAAAGYGGISVGLLLAAFFPGAGAAVALLEAAGITASDADKLVLWVTNMQEHVANQFSNAFANDDYRDATTAALWRRPGDGRSVGPDDTAWFWSPPDGFDPVIAGRVHGLYGSNMAAALRRWDWVEEVVCLWEESGGDGDVNGVVRRDLGAGLVPVTGAVVEFACRTFTTDQNGGFSGTAPKGIYLVHGSYTDPVTGYVWETVRNEVDILVPGHLDIVLRPPPAEFRKVDIVGTIDVVDRVAIGHDGWAHARPSDTAFVGPYSSLNPNPAERDEGLTWKRGKPFSAGSAGGEESCEIDVTIRWNPDLSIDVALAARLKDGDDVDDTHNDTRNIPEDASHTFVFDMSSGETWPDRAWVKLMFKNTRQK